MDARGAGGRDAEAGAAERRLAEALRAQASLSSARPVTPPGGAPQAPGRAGQPAKNPPSASKGQHPPKASGPKRPGPANGPHAGSGSPVGGQHGRGGPSHPPHAPGRGVHGSGGQRGREQPTQIGTVDPGLAGAPTTQQPTTKPAPAAQAGRPATALAERPDPGAAPIGRRLRLALLICLLSGLLLGCLLAVLSVLDPGLLPALG